MKLNRNWKLKWCTHRRVCSTKLDFWSCNFSKEGLVLGLCKQSGGQGPSSLWTVTYDAGGRVEPPLSPSIHQFNDILNFKTSELSQSKPHSFPLSTINQKCGQPAATPRMELAEGADKWRGAQTVIEELLTTRGLKSFIHTDGCKQTLGLLWLVVQVERKVG